MKNVTENLVKQTFLDMINEGRNPKVSLSSHTTPAQALERLTDSDLAKLDVLGTFKGVSANQYAVKASMLWSSLFWKIGEQILIVGNYVSPFERFYKPLELGADVEEVAPRLKEGLDRTTLSNSALLTRYTTQYDSFYHRINQFKVFATTYDQYELSRISNSWANLTNSLNVELENVLKSASVYLNDLSKEAFATQYLSGGMDVVDTPAIVDESTARQNAVKINTLIDEMTTEATEKYIPYNLNTHNATTPIKDIATSDIILIGTAELLNNIEFMTTLNTYFQGKFQNDKFSLRTIKVIDFPTTKSNNIEITDGYTDLVNPKPLKGILIEENGLLFRQRLIGTFNFDNAATLNTSVFHHMDAFANISDRRKCVAIV